MKPDAADQPPVASGACMHLIDTGGPGGAETMFCQMATRLNDSPLQSLVVVPREGWLSSSLRAHGLEPTIMDVRGSMNVSYLRELVIFAKRQRVKVIHTHLLGSAVYGALVGAILRLPVIAVFHGPTDLRAPGRLSSIKRWLLRHACSRLVAVSEGTRKALNEFGIEDSKITVIPNGIDLAMFFSERSTGLRQELQLKADDILIGAVGNVRVPKAYDVLLQAAAIVLEHTPNAHFAVVGEGNERVMRPLLQLRDSLGIRENFHFLGFRKTTPALFGNFDVFVSSSRSEGLPLSFLEAMASGLSVVATKSGGAQEVITTEQSGILVPIEDPRALAAAISRLVSEPDLRCRLAAAGRETVVKEFNLDLTIEKYARLYHELLH
jgi:glycosyltransferase involved in cell wall biosynthesis